MRSELTRREFLKKSVGTAAAVGFGGALSSLSAPAWADEFFALDGIAQAELVRSGKVTPLELLEAAIARAQALNPKLNAIVTPMYDLARDRAKNGLPSGPFTGVPTFLKDLTDYKGVRAAFGSRMMVKNVSRTTHPLAEQMEAMGMVSFGKSATPEFGLLPSTESVAFGPTNNPWDTSRSPGGSSGGNAALVAAGVVPIAQGSDGGGSIRIPSSACGLFGMKPSRGRIVEPPGKTRPGDVSVKGFLSRSVRDSQVALAASSRLGRGLPAIDPESCDCGGPLRIALMTTDFEGTPPHPEVANAVQSTAKLCEEIGHTVEEIPPPIDGEKFASEFITLWSNSPWSIVEAIKAQTGSRPPREALEPWTWGLIEHMDRQDRAEVLRQSLEHMLVVTNQMNAFLETYDVLLLPTLAEPAVETGYLGPEVPYDVLYDRVAKFAAYTPIANATGLPAMSVPLHETAAGLPIGSQFIGRLGDETLLFELAHQLEEARPWAGRWPATSAANL